MIHSDTCGKKVAFNIPVVGSEVLFGGKKELSKSISAPPLKSGSGMISTTSDPYAEAQLKAAR